MMSQNSSVKSNTLNIFKKLKLVSLNVNGLHSNTKREKVFEYLGNLNADMYLLQETHSTPEAVKTWQTDWKGNSFWNSGPDFKSSGVAILLKQNQQFKILNTRNDNQGKTMSLTFEYDKQLIQVINIYGPTRPTYRAKYFKKLKHYIDANTKTIIGGDFNMVENLSIDRKGGNPRNTHLIGLDQLNKLKQKYNLFDTWRQQHPLLQQFTYHNSDFTIHSRLDRFYMTNTFKIKKIEIIPSPHSDHDGVSLEIYLTRSKPSGSGH